MTHVLSKWPIPLADPTKSSPLFCITNCISVCQLENLYPDIRPYCGNGHVCLNFSGCQLIRSAPDSFRLSSDTRYSPTIQETDFYFACMYSRCHIQSIVSETCLWLFWRFIFQPTSALQIFSYCSTLYFYFLMTQWFCINTSKLRLLDYLCLVRDWRGVVN